MPTFISLPNGTIIDAEKIVSVDARNEFKSFIDNTPPYPPAAILVYNPDPSSSLHHRIECQSYEEACDVRDRIVAVINRISPVTKT